MTAGFSRRFSLPVAAFLILLTGSASLAAMTEPAATQPPAETQESRAQQTLQAMFGNKKMPELPDFDKGQLTVISSGENHVNADLSEPGETEEREEPTPRKKVNPTFSELAEAVDDL